MELSVCICVRDGERHVDRCLGALVRETASFQTPILVVDHASRDRTPQLLERWCRDSGGRIQLLRFEGEGLAAARDFAWRQTTTPWLAFVDVDCEVQGGWAQAAYQGVQRYAADPTCGGFGGNNRVPSGGVLYRAYAVLLSTYVGGHDSILNRAVDQVCTVEHCPTLNVVYRRSALAAIDGFDHAYTRVCEDLQVSSRLVRSGHRLWTNPTMVVEHALRPTLSGWLRNLFLYGRGRCFHIKRHPEDFHPKFLAPPTVVLLYLALLLTGHPALLLLAAGGHLAGVAVLLAGAARRQGEGLRAWLCAAVVAWLTHLAFGAGMLSELPRRRGKFVYRP